MKKIVKKFVVLGLMCVILFSGCSNKTSNDVTMLKRVKNAGKIVVGTSPDYPPFEFLISDNGNGNIVGADIELGKKIADSIGVNFEIKAMDFDALIPALQGNQVDIVITGMSPNENRIKSVDFSDIYFEGKNGILVRSGDEKKYCSESDLKNIKIGVQKGSTQEIFVKEKLNIESFKSLISVPDLIMDLKNGNIDVIVLNDIVADINSKKYDGISNVKDFKFLNNSEEELMAIAVKKGNNKEFLDIINEEIKRLKDTGEYAKILTDSVDKVSDKK